MIFILFQVPKRFLNFALFALVISILLFSSITLQGCISTAGENHINSQIASTQIPLQQQQTVMQFSPHLQGLAVGLASQIRSNLKDDDLGNWPCVMTTLMEIDNLERSSRFGRSLAEAIGSEIFRLGGKVLEIRAGTAFYVERETGEMVLTRDIDNLVQNMNVRAVITGTYTTGATSVTVNLRMINLSDKSIISVAFAEIARTATVDSLLNASGVGVTPTAYDKMP